MSSPERKNQSKSIFDKQYPLTASKNKFISVEPSQVLFHSYMVGHTITQTLRIINISGSEQRFHILPLESGQFSLHYDKKRKLLPGMNQPIKVTFDPKDYSKCVQALHIHCPNEENLSIPIVACPTPELAGFPSTLHFSNTSIGRSNLFQFTLSSNIFTPFQYSLQFNPPTEVYSVLPSSGSVPPEGNVLISVTFTPTQLRTTLSNLELSLPEIDSEIRICPCTGSCLPNNPTANSKPIGKSRVSTKLLQKGGVKSATRKVGINTKRIAAVPSNTIINKSEETCQLSFGDRERDFLLQVCQNKDQEKLSQLRGLAMIGSPQQFQSDPSQLISQREMVNNSSNSKPLKLTQRMTSKIERSREHFGPEFGHVSPYNNLKELPNWRKKKESFGRFSMAAKRVIIQLRAKRRLKSIQQYLQTQTDEKDQSQTPSSDGDFIFPNFSEPIPFLFINEAKNVENLQSMDPFVPFTLSMPDVEFEVEEPTFPTIAPVYHEQQNYRRTALSSHDTFLPITFGKKKREGAKHEYLGVETQKQEAIISETISQPIPENLKKCPPFTNNPTVDPIEDVPVYLPPLCPVTENSPEYNILSVKAKPNAQIRTGQTEFTPENNFPPEQEKYVDPNEEAKFQNNK